MNDLELEREIRATFGRRGVDVLDPELVPPVRQVIRRTRHRQIAAVLTGVAIAAAVAVASVAGAVALLRASEEKTPAEPPDTPAPIVTEETSLAACPDGSDPDAPGPVEQARPLSGPMAFDRQSGVIVLKEFVIDGTSATWTFDVCSNTWRQMSPNVEPGQSPAGRAWGPIAYDADSDLTITMLDDGSLWAYDFESDTWTEKGHPPLDNSGYSTIRMVYDPVSGLVVAIGAEIAAGYERSMWTYDVESDTWKQIAPTVSLAAADHQLYTYDASVDRIVTLASRARVQTFDRRGGWSPPGELNTLTPEFNTGYFASGGEAAYDEAAERTVVFSDGFVISYDATPGGWASVYRASRYGEGPFNRLGHWMVYDPLNERLVIYGGSARGMGRGGRWSEMDDVWAFDGTAGGWVELLLRSRPPA